VRPILKLRNSSQERQCCREKRNRACDEKGVDRYRSGCRGYNTKRSIISATLATKEERSTNISHQRLM
jgi:hypothetical protein